MNYKNKIVVTIPAIRPDIIRFESIFRKLDETFTHIMIHSGQHFDFNLRDAFYNDLELRKPDYILNSGAMGRPHYIQQGECGKQIIELLQEKGIKPDVIIFLGDSNSVLASIPLKKEGYKIAHVEALMRSGDIRMAEEINRIMCDHCSDFLFTYHENYKEKGLKEGISNDNIFVVGNTICEPALKIKNKLISEGFKPSQKHIILDIHRPENFKYKERLEEIIRSASELGLHYNLPVKMLDFPRTSENLQKFKTVLLNNVEIVPLMGYVDFIKAQMESKFIISDSGSAQEECPLLEIPLLVPRGYTERPESYESNNSKMMSIPVKIPAKKYIEWIDNWTPKNSDTSWLYNGLKDGETTSQKIVDILKEKL